MIQQYIGIHTSEYMHSKEVKARCQRNLYSHVHSNIIHNSQGVEETQCLSTDEWVKCEKYMLWNTIQPSKGSFNTYYNMHEP